MLKPEKTKLYKEQVKYNCQKLEDIALEIGDALSVHKLWIVRDEIIKMIDKRSEVVEGKDDG